jgi:anhydro-N-acetylmuramic acid kinase
MDGIDGIVARIEIDPLSGTLTDYEVLGTHTERYSAEVQTELNQLVQEQRGTLLTLAQLNRDVGLAFAQVAETLHKRHPAELIASHGQTVFHLPPSATQLGHSLQLGHGDFIAATTGLPVIADFRNKAMAKGEQGAPLIPYADWLLLNHPEKTRWILNIGGIANITVLPAGGLRTDAYGFDTGPGNTLIDEAMRFFYQQPYDDQGLIGASGRIDEALLMALLAHEYLQAAPPKSTGKEMFGHSFVQAYLKNPLYKSLAPQDWVATFTAFTAESIDAALKNQTQTRSGDAVIIGGGGLRNTTLMKHLDRKLQTRGLTVSSHEDIGINSQYKEALAFALLGYARWYNLPNHTQPEAYSLGVIYTP